MALNIGVHIGVFGSSDFRTSTLTGIQSPEKCAVVIYHDTGGAVTDFGSTDLNCV